MLKLISEAQLGSRICLCKFERPKERMNRNNVIVSLCYLRQQLETICLRVQKKFDSTFIIN